MSEDQSAHDEALSSVKRIQDFEVDSLERAELGANFKFDDAIQPAARLVSLFSKVPIEALAELPKNDLKKVQAEADSTYNLFDSVLEFDETVDGATSRRQTLVSQIEGKYDPTFSVLMPYISFGVARTVDFNRIESEGRATLQVIRD